MLTSKCGRRSPPSTSKCGRRSPPSRRGRRIAAARPRPATHSILASLKAGEKVFHVFFLTNTGFHVPRGAQFVSCSFWRRSTVWDTVGSRLNDSCYGTRLGSAGSAERPGHSSAGGPRRSRFSRFPKAPVHYPKRIPMPWNIVQNVLRNLETPRGMLCNLGDTPQRSCGRWCTS